MPVKLPPDVLRFFQETGAKGGESRTKAKQKSSAANGSSPEARAKISRAQKLRWKQRKAEKAKQV